MNTIDSWLPAATREALVTRATVLARIRRFFADRGVLEVETPILSHAATTDPRLQSFVTRYTGPGAPRGTPLFLHTSPEFPMKRLLAAGSGSIFQICKVFRDGETGRLHNPEFTLLEWYRVGFDHLQLMDEVAALIRETLADVLALGPAVRLSYRDAFGEYCGLDPHTAETTELRARARSLNLAPDLGDDRDAWLDLLLTHAIEPHLGRGHVTLLYDYPASQAALARVRPGPPAVAERFEAYLNGVELANGFHELADAGEQRARFACDLRRRAAERLAGVAVDERLLAALAAGLPDCAGVALGIDRLVMLRAGARSLHEVLAFPIDRA